MLSPHSVTRLQTSLKPLRDSRRNASIPFQKPFFTAIITSVRTLSSLGNWREKSDRTVTSVRLLAALQCGLKIENCLCTQASDSLTRTVRALSLWTRSWRAKAAGMIIPLIRGPQDWGRFKVSTSGATSSAITRHNCWAALFTPCSVRRNRCSKHVAFSSCCAPMTKKKRITERNFSPIKSRADKKVAQHRKNFSITAMAHSFIAKDPEAKRICHRFSVVVCAML